MSSCPTSAPSDAAAARTIGSSITVGIAASRPSRPALSGDPSGECAVTWMPSRAHHAISSSLRQYGWHSTCTTLGRMRAYSRIAATFFVLKLLTPMLRTSPASTSASIASQVSRMLGRTSSPRFIVTGQCIRYRSRYPARSSRMDFSHAARTRAAAWSVFQSLEVMKRSARDTAPCEYTVSSASPTSPSFW